MSNLSYWGRSDLPEIDGAVGKLRIGGSVRVNVAPIRTTERVAQTMQSRYITEADVCVVEPVNAGLGQIKIRRVH